MKIKENIQILHQQREATHLDLEKIDQILSYFEEIKVQMPREQEMVQTLEKNLTHLLKQAGHVEEQIADKIKEESQKTNVELE